MCGGAFTLTGASRLSTTTALNAALPAVAPDPLADLTQAERLESLNKAVLNLPIRYREVVVLCDLQEMPYAEAADALGCAIGTVRSRLHRGRALLTAKMQELERAAAPADRVIIKVYCMNEQQQRALAEGLRALTERTKDPSASARVERAVIAEMVKVHRPAVRPTPRRFALSALPRGCCSPSASPHGRSGPMFRLRLTHS